MLKNTLLTTIDKEELSAPDTSCTLTVYPYILGDANNSGTVTVTDVVTAARYILNYHPEPFVIGAADLNMDGKITVTDVVMIAQIVLDGEVIYPYRAPMANSLDGGMIAEVLNVDGQRHTVSISLDNTTDYTAFQLDLQLPEGCTADNFTLTNTSGSHSLDVNTTDDGKTRLLCYTPSLEALNGNAATLLTFDVMTNDDTAGDILVSDIELVTTSCRTVNLDAFAIRLNGPTSVSELTAAVRVYSESQSIVVETTKDVAVNICDIMGRNIRVDAKCGRTVIPVNGKGIYVVNAAGNTAKLMIK